MSGVTGYTKDGADGKFLTQTAAASTYVPTAPSGRTDTRLIGDNASVYSSGFTYSAISSTQDGHLVWKNLTVHSGFGGQVGQGGLISYFKAVGGTITHDGPGNIDVFWNSTQHKGTREAGMFIGDLTGSRGGNVYGGHFQVKSNTTAPKFMVGGIDELVPTVAKGTTSANTMGAGVAANTPTTSLTLGSAVQLTDGTNISMIDSLGSTVVAYVAGSMGASSTTVPVDSFTSVNPINSASAVTVGVASTYYGRLIQNNGSVGASAAIQIEAPNYTGNKAVDAPFPVGINFDGTAASAVATAISLSGSWANALNCNGSNVNNLGSAVGVGTSPNRDVRLVDNLLLDNARYIKFKDSGGTAQKAISATSSNNLRFKRIASGTQFEFYDETEATLLARITSSGRGDFSTGGVTSKYNTAAPSFITNGHVEVYYDGTSHWLVAHSNGATRKVALT